MARYLVRPRWFKVMRDLWGNKTRTILVVLSIAVGVFAVGVIQGSKVMLKNGLNDSYRAVNPASATLYTDPFDQNMLEAVRRSKILSEADARSVTSVRFKHGDSDEWLNLNITAVADFDDQKINKFKLEEGKWPPCDDEILFERTTLDILQIREGDTITIETPGNEMVELKAVGFVHDIQQIPARFSGAVCGYATLDTIEHLGLPRTFNRLTIIVEDNKLSEKHIRDVANDIKDSKLEPSGVLVRSIGVPEPGKHAMDNSVTAMTMILSVLSILSLMLSGFLVINTISAILAQQTKQIGIMKSVGGIRNQIAGLYYSIIVIYGVLSLFISIPLGAIGAKELVDFTISLLNFDVDEYNIPPYVLMMEIAVGLIVPVLAALYPILQGTRVTVRRAIFSYGLENIAAGEGLIDRILIRMRGISLPMLISIRNTFRRKGRLVLTLTTLTLAAAVFISVFSVRSSLLNTLESLMEYWKYDIEVTLDRPYRFTQIQRAIMRVSGVADVENWSGKAVTRLRPDGTENDQLRIVAPPAKTTLIQPTVLEGRWLVPTDKDNIVVNTDVLDDEKDIKLGDTITLKIGAQKTRWHVVGIVKGMLSGSVMYANQTHMARLIDAAGQTSWFAVETKFHDGDSQADIAETIEKRLKKVSIRVKSTDTNTKIRERISFQFSVLVVFLMIMAVLLALVGGLGLMGTMSINVLERTREIGVMRAVGASNFTVFRVFIVEGIIIGVISWFFGAILAIPLSKILSDQVGNAFLNTLLDYKFSIQGVGIWLGIVLLISCSASLMPAWRAVRISVRDTLSYE